MNTTVQETDTAVEATVTSKGQITLPKELGGGLESKTGSRIRFSIAASGAVRVELCCMTSRPLEEGRSGRSSSQPDEFRGNGRGESPKNGSDCRRYQRMGARLPERRSGANREIPFCSCSVPFGVGGVFVPLLVLAELSWVLRGRWERERVLSTIESLLRTRFPVCCCSLRLWH